MTSSASTGWHQDAAAAQSSVAAAGRVFNGRVAMLGFVIGLLTEAITGNGIVSQITRCLRLRLMTIFCYLRLTAAAVITAAAVLYASLPICLLSESSAIEQVVAISLLPSLRRGLFLCLVLPLDGVAADPARLRRCWLRMQCVQAAC